MSTKIKKFGNDSNNRITVSLNTDKLDAIEKELGRVYRAQVGVLGSGAAGRMVIKSEKVGGKSGKKTVPVVQGDSNLSNADIGLIHEKGSYLRNIPRRSFLEAPLTTKMPEKIARVGRIILEGINASNIVEAYKKLGDIAEGIVLQAFPTSGYGKWPDLSRGGPSHLIDTGQLRASISSRVVTK